MKRSIFLFLLFVLILTFSFGCAKTVVPKPQIGDQMRIEISFRDKIDTTNNKYYIIIGANSVNLMNKGNYFFAPGEVYDIARMDLSTEVQYYYDYFFSSWKDFIKLTNGTFYITNGPFLSFVSHNTFIAKYLSYLAIPSPGSGDEKKLILTFDLSKLSYPLPEQIYFNFVCVDSSSKIKDLLLASDNKISPNIGSKVYNIAEPADNNIDGSLDIISWSVEIQ